MLIRYQVTSVVYLLILPWVWFAFEIHKLIHFFIKKILYISVLIHSFCLIHWKCPKSNNFYSSKSCKYHFKYQAFKSFLFIIARSYFLPCIPMAYIFYFLQNCIFVANTIHRLIHSIPFLHSLFFFPFTTEALMSNDIES